MSFDYVIVDISMHKGRPAIDPILSTMKRKGWSPLVIIDPTDEYPSYSIVFKRKVEESDSDE
jgi:hypothetical protein